MKRKDLIALQNRDAMTFLAERRQEMASVQCEIREQQEEIMHTMQRFECLHGTYVPKERERTQEKLRTLFACIHQMMPVEPPTGTLTMSFEQLEQTMKITYESFYRIIAIARLQRSLSKQLTTIGLNPTRYFIRAMQYLPTESLAALRSIEESAQQVLEGKIAEVPPEDIERYRQLVRERSSSTVLGDRVLDISRELIEEILDRRIALAARYEKHIQQKGARKCARTLSNSMLTSGLEKEYACLEELPPDEELLVIDKTIFSMKQFAADFAGVLLAPEMMCNLSISVSRATYHKLLPHTRKQLEDALLLLIRQDFMKLMAEDSYECIPAKEYRNCVLALQRTLRERPEELFKHVTYYGQMTRNEQRLCKEIIALFMEWLLESPWEEMEAEAADPEESPAIP